MDKKINGLVVSDILYNELNKYLLQKDIVPRVVDISIGDDFGGQMYAKMKEKKITDKTLIDFISVHFNEMKIEELEEYIKRINLDKSITGMMIQLPLPSNFRGEERRLLDMINPDIDVDGLTSLSMGKLSVLDVSLIPCTALGIETLLKSYDVTLEGKKVAIINRSNIVGKPLAHLMLRNNATPVICHSKTSNLSEVTSDCDIVVAALNKQEFITADYIKKDAVVIDVGVHKNKEGKTVGDVDFLDVYPKASLITPPTGAVGPMTICMLAYNCAKSVYGQEVDDVLEQGIRKVKKIIKEKNRNL